MKTLIAILLFVAPALSHACTQAEAREYFQSILDTVVEPCEILEVSEEKRDWWGGKYYLMQTRCAGQSQQVLKSRIYEHPDTQKCTIPY